MGTERPQMQPTTSTTTTTTHTTPAVVKQIRVQQFRDTIQCCCDLSTDCSDLLFHIIVF